MSNRARVLIVGAGPVGLSAAVALSRVGIPIRIVDRLPAPINQSRAAIIHARTLEHFQRLGIVEEFLATGVKVHGVVVYDSEQRILVRPSLDHIPSPYPYMLGLEQFKTEKILTARLEESGVKVERGVELAEFKENDDKVSAVLRLPDGTEEQCTFDYLLGSDGSHSTVRAGLGLHLEGTTIDQTWITVDVKIRWDRDPGEAVACLAEEGIVFIAAMNDDRWRVIVSHQHMTPEEAAKATVADVEKMMSERFGMTMSLYDPVWISPFGLNTRMSPTMQAGRVFLAGDAAHVHSPVGGQGMNTGIQDSLNLAWKLALVLKGLAKPALLESYNAERHANAK
ncbi:MAG: FAD-dependent monooxygenase, partial [Terrimicrobiaceae bacterium]